MCAPILIGITRGDVYKVDIFEPILAIKCVQISLPPINYAV